MMFKALLKKQLLEVNQFYFKDRKTGKNRSVKGTVGYVLLFSLLLAANALLELLTEQRVKSWVWLLNVAGIVGCVADLFHCKNLRVAKAEDENA